MAALADRLNGIDDFDLIVARIDKVGAFGGVDAVYDGMMLVRLVG